ncbi:MAG: glycosyltransferase [Candidatus Poribacteria bacterium]|nr:glycosyltransferase [Candidatus Poribacteria bacterium]
MKTPEFSARQTLSTTQKLFLLAFLVISGGLVYLDWFGYLLGFVGLAMITYTVVTLLKLSVVGRFMLGQSPVISLSADEVAALDENTLPKYTILVPLYREAIVLPALADHLCKLDYPTNQLEIFLLLESDDTETIGALKKIDLPSHFHQITIPDTVPKTKPKACNVGLERATGEYVVIYDAEDRPDPDQLKKAILAFRHHHGSRYTCFQAKLDFYNPRQNLLTKLFALEYAFWFELLLPSLVHLNAPIPLGGTSNHFPTERLRELGGWDAYNVTEDCELGVRLKRSSNQVGMIDSTTWEEANSRLGNWIRQRSRWLKGYLQTYFAHNRRPFRLFRDIGFWNVLHFHVLIGAGPLLCLINPVFWGMFWIHLATGSAFVERLFPTPSLYVGVFSLIVGNFAFVWLSMVGALIRKEYDLVKYALLMPLSWGLMSVAAWKALFQLIRVPHFWEKTNHGLTSRSIHE